MLVNSQYYFVISNDLTIPETGDFNDLWEFDGQYWTWMSGSMLSDQAGIYGSHGVPSSSNVPGSRDSAMSWIDSNNTLWLFGGNRYDSTWNQGNACLFSLDLYHILIAILSNVISFSDIERFMGSTDSNQLYVDFNIILLSIVNHFDYFQCSAQQHKQQ